MALNLTKKQLKALGISISESEKPNKYRSKACKIDGITFQSTAEANYYYKLRMLVKAKKIAGFCRQPRFVITEGDDNTHCVEYVADFIEFHNDGTYRIVDVKGIQTPVFKLKMKSLHEKYPTIKIKLRAIIKTEK